MAAKTHYAIVVRAGGRQRVRVHMSPTTWVVNGHECYYRDTGARVGAPGRSRIELDSIKPIDPMVAKDGDA